MRPEPTDGEEGSALIEFVGLGVLLLLPLLYLLLSVFAVQRAAFAVTQAARDALARKAGVSSGASAATTANPPGARRAHWWTDTPLREENKQRLGRGGSGEDR